MHFSSTTSRPRISIVVDPRFPGGTSSAVARELFTLSGHADLQVHAIESDMFKERKINRRLEAALEELGIELIWNRKLIRDEIVIFHNPACLKFNTCLDTKIVCGQAYVVTHENFVSPSGREGFDVGHCLDLLGGGLLAGKKALAPVSGYNRRNIVTWLSATGYDRNWTVAERDWFNICDFELVPPTTAPRDRRGRLSRPGFEKFPSLAAMVRHFPAHAEACHILGGDNYLLEPESCPKHWNILPFGTVPVAQFLKNLDFFVYFTHPSLRESFGRVIPEAIAAGKLVITDSYLAETFGDAVVQSNGTDVDEIITDYLAKPGEYASFVSRAQESLVRFSDRAFRANAFKIFNSAGASI